MLVKPKPLWARFCGRSAWRTRLGEFHTPQTPPWSIYAQMKLIEMDWSGIAKGWAFSLGGNPAIRRPKLWRHHG